MTKVKLVKTPHGYFEVAEKPRLEELREYYANEYFQQESGNYRHSYTPDEMQYFRAKIAQRARAAEKLGLQKGKFLDVGCGEGLALAYYHEAKWQVEGIDFSNAGVKAMNPQLRDVVEIGDMTKLLDERIAQQQSYDLIWLTNVLEHVLDPPGLLRRLRALMSDAGVLCVTVPNDFSDLQQMLLETNCIDDEFWVGCPDHLAYFDRESLARTAQSCGWMPRTFLADFPIDLFLLHPGSNYVRDRTKGPAAHHARVSLEMMLNSRNIDQLNAFYEAMAHVGLGRNITALLTKNAA